MPLSYWSLLGFVVWTLALVVLGIGIPRLTAIQRQEARPNSFVANVPHGSERYQRTLRAHMNCVENLPVFFVLVWLGAELHVPGSLFQIAAMLVLPARILQSSAHIVSGRNRAVLFRFAFYLVQLACFGVLTAMIVWQTHS